jgi:signal transduction histidine kinase
VAEEDDAGTLRRRLDEVDQLRRRIIAVVGHELRTPVTTVHGLAEALLTADVEAIRQDIAPRLVRNVRRLERLLDDMLIASGISTVLPVAPVAPEAVGPAIRSAWSAIDGEGDLRIDGDEEATVALRAGSLYRVLRHVLRNSVAYGHSPIEVAVRAGAPFVTVVVSSPGEPVADDVLTLGFEPFWRGEAAVMAAAGFGLGLTVSRLLLEQSGGTIAIDRRDGGGLVTTIELPAS